MFEDGYIKYHITWKQSHALPYMLIAALNNCRSHLHDSGLIGFYADSGIGFGNVSCRIAINEKGLFIISGTQTGHISRLTSNHYSLVTAYNLLENSLCCKGPIKASSEALTHAVLYDLDKTCGAVIHIHHRQWWEILLGKVPTTQKHIEYGTPQMAFEMTRLYHESTLAQEKIVVMAGHEEGIVVYDNDCEKALNRLLFYWQQCGF